MVEGYTAVGKRGKLVPRHATFLDFIDRVLLAGIKAVGFDAARGVSPGQKFSGPPGLEHRHGQRRQMTTTLYDVRRKPEDYHRHPWGGTAAKGPLAHLVQETATVELDEPVRSTVGNDASGMQSGDEDQVSQHRVELDHVGNGTYSSRCSARFEN